MSYPDEQDQNFPAARKGSSGGDAGFGGLNPAGDQWSAPLSPDHNPGWETGSSVPLGPYGDNGGYPPSTPYRPGPVPGYAPPPPVGPRVGQTSPQGRRRRGVAIIFAFIAVLLAGTLSALLFLRTNDGSNNNNQGNGPGLAVATDTLVPTPTLKPGQTPLPTRVPTQVPPTPLPGQPTATPIPFASSAAVSFTAVEQNISVPSSFTTPAGGAVPTTTESTPGSGITQAVTKTQEQFAAQPATYFLTVRNNGNGQATSAGATIHSTAATGSIACFLQGSLTINAHTTSSTLQACITSPGAQPNGVIYSNTSDNSPFQYTGGPFGASGSSDEYWEVPTDCATNSQNVSDAQSADKAAISSNLNSQVPGGSAVFYAPAYSYGSLTCTPSAGTKTYTPSRQTYSVAVTGNGTQTSYKPQDAINYQNSQLQAKAGTINPPGDYSLIRSSVCSSPTAQDIDANNATITCFASGTAAFNWSSSSAHSTFDGLITGQPKQTAISAINAVQGVASGSASVSLSGGSYVPQNGSAISYNIKTP